MPENTSGVGAIEQARAAKAAGRGAKVLIACSILAGILYGLADSPLFRVKRVRIHCVDRIAARQAARAVLVPPGETTITLNARRFRKRIVACPRVKDARVSKRPPHIVVVEVEPRRPTVALITPGGCLLADDEGVCVEQVAVPPLGIPCVRGIPVTGVRDGDRVVGPRMRTAMECVRWARRLRGLGAVTVDVSALDDIRVWTASGTPCLVGHARDLGLKMASFAAALEFLREKDVRARYVDVRDPDGPIVWEPAPSSPA